MGENARDWIIINLFILPMNPLEILSNQIDLILSETPSDLEEDVKNYKAELEEYFAEEENNSQDLWKKLRR